VSETERTARVGHDPRNVPGTDLGQILGNDSGNDLGPSGTPLLLRFPFINEIHAKASHGGWISSVQLSGSTGL
jgi:hypothetical protein